MNTIKTAIVLSIITTLGLSGCVEPKIPVTNGNQGPGITACDVAQVLDTYSRLTSKTVGATETVDRSKPILIKQTRPMTRAEAIKLIEQNLHDQARVIVIHRDRRHIVFGLSGDVDQRPALWLSPH